MFSFKPLALYALFAFGVLSSVAIPRNRDHIDSNGSGLSDTIQTLSTSLQSPLAQMGSLSASDANPETVKPIVDNMHSAFSVAIQGVQSYHGCGEDCSGGSGDGLDDLLGSVGELLNDVLEVVAEVVDLVDGVLESLGPLLNSVGDDVVGIVDSLSGVLGSDTVTEPLASSLGGDTATMKVMAPKLLTILGL
ncbi:hypothetical protein EIP86_006777 [Pleurotus ostreatoroseus]|nr:hypothetical protein EIP86_006777 [Pleurotus ostreatoroseus]